MVFGAVTAQAQLVGTFNVGGTVRATDAGDPLVLLNFGATAADDNVQVSNGTGDFAFLPPGAPPGLAGLMQGLIVGVGPVNTPNFLTFGNFTFTLQGISPGDFGAGDCFSAPAGGQNCTPPGTGFNLSNFSIGGDIGTVASVQIFGTVSEIVGGRTGRFTASIAQTLVGQSYQELITIIDNGGTITEDLSVDFEVSPNVIPEPSTYALMATGLVGLLGAARLRRNNV